MKLDFNELKNFLDEKVDKYNCSDFIESDPVSIPHQFIKKEDVEISGFLTATIAWGKRKTILTNATKLMNMMDNSPHEFITGFKKKDLMPFKKFVHRTLNGDDCCYFLTALQHIYLYHGGLSFIFQNKSNNNNLAAEIVNLRNLFFSLPHLKRTEKHFADPSANSSAKRICMFLRWMIRNDKRGVDFGLWNTISPSRLSCPLDIHSGRVARALGLLSRNQNDWKAVTELTGQLKMLDSHDPVKYDYALFGLGVNEVM